MAVPFTFLALACMIGLAVAFRLRWPTLHPRQQKQALVLFLLFLLPVALNLISRWETTSSRLNHSLGWMRILAYVQCVVFFTLLRPRWLTILVAIVLTFPIFASSIVGPLSGSFLPRRPVIHPVADGYYLEALPWTSGPGHNSGMDFTLFYRPDYIHLFRRPFLGMRLYNTQCATAASFATLDRDAARIDLHCPPLSTDPAAPPSGAILPFLIPRGAQSPAIAQRQRR